MSKKVLILGVNGFIGNHLTEAIIERTDWEVYGMDIGDHKLGHLVNDPRVHFIEGDITINKEWIAYHIKKCDVVLPLVAIATPSVYVEDPLRVFELDFEANLNVIRQCVEHGTRIIFPSTSEVYGMSDTPEFDEMKTNLVLGPIHKQRWIYSCSKQLLDRVIYAYGVQHQFDYTLFRPFNWFGPKLDDVFEPKEGSSRVLSQFISNVIHGKEIKLVEGGRQRRSFTYIDDGIDALMRMIENESGGAHQRIFNIGNPHNDFSIQELANIVVKTMMEFPFFAKQAESVNIINVSSQDYYGEGYQDVSARVPSINNAKTYLNWEPKVAFEAGLRKTLDYYCLQQDG